MFFPGSYIFDSTVVLRGNVRRVLGAGNSVNYGRDANPEFRIEDSAASTIWFEHFQAIGHDHPGVEVASDRTVVFKSLETDLRFRGGGEVFLEDVCTHNLRFNPDQKVWARQLNVENEGTHITNAGGALWILGLKTERGGTLVDTRTGRKAEVFGNFSYTTTAGRLAPMFVNKDSSVFAFFHEVRYTGDPFHILIRETRGTESREMIRGDGKITPYIGFADRLE